MVLEAEQLQNLDTVIKQAPTFLCLGSYYSRVVLKI